MKIVVFGASGSVGKLVVSEALERGHEVRAFVRDEQTIDAGNARLELFESDIYKPDEVLRAVKGCDAIVSVLGGKIFGGPMVCRDGIKAILTAMKEYKVKRLIALSAFGASEDKDFSPYTRLLRFGIPMPMRDKDEMEKLLLGSKLDWTVIRPGAFMEIWPKKSYRTVEVLASPFPAITRGAVAECIVDQLHDKTNVRKAIAIEGA